MIEFNSSFFPIKVQFIEHDNLIKIMTYNDYLNNRKSFIVLETNVKGTTNE